MANNQASFEHFSNLPIEIKHKIFSFLCSKETLNLRLINHHFKKVIDNYDCVWKIVKLKIDFDSAMNKIIAARIPNEPTSYKPIFDPITEQLSFLYTKKHIISIELKCSEQITDIEYLESFLNQFSLKDQVIPISTSPESLYVVECNRLNVNLIICLSLFSNNCNRLKITSFRDSSLDLLRETIAKTKIDFGINGNFWFPNLSCLDINCQLFDSVAFPEYSAWRDSFAKNILLNQIDKIFVNLKHLHLRNYNDSGTLIFRKISNLKR